MSSADSNSFAVIKFCDDTSRYQVTWTIDDLECIYEEVQCPPIVDMGEWIAYYIYLIREDLAYLFDAIADECTLGLSCCNMSAGIHYYYYWSDKKRYHSPVMFHTRRYVNTLFSWVNDLLHEDCQISSDNKPRLNALFSESTSRIFRRLLHVYAHIYNSHMYFIFQLGLAEEFLYSYCCALFLVDIYSLIGPTDLDPLYPLNIQILPYLKSYYNRTIPLPRYLRDLLGEDRQKRKNKGMYMAQY
ncbi:hypothetical protein WA171_006640 [Blastocystis sp. BT1]